MKEIKIMKKFIFITLILLLATVVSAAKIGELPQLMRPYMMQVDAERLYVSDEYRVFI